jgi:thiol:disulfide interchange protein DsbA
MMRFIAVVLIAGLSFAACSKDTPTAPPADSAATAAMPSAAPAPEPVAAASSEQVAQLAASPQLLAGRWKAGTHYAPVIPAQPTSVAAGKVEVIEVFWYGCPHCYALDPFLESWKKNKPSYIEFIRMPVMWQPVHRAHARLFYTLQALGKLEQLHSKVFDEFHEKKNPLASTHNDEMETRNMQLAFARANGISEKDFLGAYNSMGVETNLRRADDFTQRYQVAGVPLIVVNGRYTTDVGMAGGQGELLKLINDLAASEKRR